MTAPFTSSARGGLPTAVLAMSAAFLVYDQSTAINVLLPPLQQEFAASRAELEWAVNAYSLSFAAVMLGAGALVDVWGARRVFLIGMGIFAVCCAGCAVAPTMLLLILALLLLGIGAALLIPSSLVLATASATTPQQRTKNVAMWASSGGIGMSAGPLLGGALTEMGSWQLMFWFHAAIAAVSALAGARLLPTVARVPHPLDVPGQIAATLAFGGLVFALVQSADQGLSPMVLGAFAVAVVGVIAFVVIESRVAAPLMPLAVWRNRVFLGASLQGALWNLALYGLLFALGLLLQTGMGMSVLHSSLMFLPLTIAILVGNLTVSRITEAIDRVDHLLAGAQTVFALSLLGLAWAGWSQSIWGIIVAMIPAGFASGLLVPTMTTQSLATVPRELHGAASAAFNTLRQVGGSIGVAVFGILLGSELDAGFARCLIAAAAATVVALVLTPLTQRPRRAA